MIRRLPAEVATRLSKRLAARWPEPFSRRLRAAFFIVGCGRSGMTLLHSLLSEHRDVAGYPLEANELWHPAAYPWHVSGAEAPPHWVDPRAYAEASTASRTPDHARRMQAVFGAYQFLSGRSCFLHKSAMMSLLLPWVVRAFPEARLITIVRDGRAVAFSAARKQREKIDRAPDAFRARGLDIPLESVLERFADLWTATILEIERQKSELGLDREGRVIEVRYEELCRRPARELARVAGFMGLDPTRFRPKEDGAVRSMDHKFREALPPPVLERITRILGPGLELKGYR